jgi:phosphoglycerol transferase MdoB-like AlkP superfamily enzyme
MSLWTLIKFVISALLVIVPNVIGGDPFHAILELIELAVVYFCVLLLGRHLRFVGYVLSSLVSLVIIAQEWVRLFAGNYTSKVMLDNVANLHALGPSLPKYIALVILAVVIAFLPISFKRYPTIRIRLVLLLGSALFFVGVVTTGRQSALTGTYDLFLEYRAAAKTAQRLAAAEQHKQQTMKKFEQHSIASGVNISTKKPNVIVIFAEGTSRKVIEETNDKYPGLMSNVQKFAAESDNFVNYYNHTAATYKGIRGQLFSAFQYYDGFENTSSAKVIAARTKTSMQGIPQILRNNGYTTEFINPEPKHPQFTPYLNQLGFNQVISGNQSQWHGSGQDTYLSDQDNFNLLFNQAKKLNQQSKHFMMGTYTFQTHNGWNSATNQYGDGKNAVLNKFHNFDIAFGSFLKKFMASDLKNNTILIYTTDHASYASPDYAKTMDDSRSAFVSTVPLMIYYPGVKPQTIDAKGRNSLGLAPTILDLMNISRAKNYFLGTSLYTNALTKYETTSEIGNLFYTTANNRVETLPTSAAKLKNQILKYDSFSLNMNYHETIH